VSKSLIVVLVNGGPVSIDWLRRQVGVPGSTVHAVVEAFDGGQSAGQALAEVLFGDVNPSGVLPFTLYPEAFVDKVLMSNMAMRPGPMNPGRTYRFYTGTPLWPFGAGKSYTSFEIKWSHRDIKSHKRGVDAQQVDELQWTVTVTNTGRQAGAKVVMAFAGKKAGTGDTFVPAKPSLWAVQKVWLKPGEEARLVFAAAENSWCPLCTTDNRGVRAVRSGSYTVRIGGHGGADNGSCLHNECAETTIQVTGSDQVRPL
jgi:hypothetical protein